MPIDLFLPGERVLTVKPACEPRGYAPGARDGNRWGVLGRVLKLSDSHGCCYHVQHDQGGTGWYEPDELVFPVHLTQRRQPVCKDSVSRNTASVDLSVILTIVQGDTFRHPVTCPECLGWLTQALKL